MPKEKVLSKEQQTLCEMGVTLPSTPSAAKSLTRWIYRGGNETGKRIGILKAAEDKFVGKRVRHKGENRFGKVRWIVFRGMGIRIEAVRASPEHKYTHPLDANVEWDDGQKSISSIGSLEVVHEK